ncbi:McKusick-Kaufman/Bardet-Biedl syndromes putative chaperonin [Dipodomys spectabilis]|uniref:McKusick-Kaufman/Bardet-Biedl syndromes putative chaperonin n=1 Tax=Dipodomys spectabilis TaxID=105255 RepID=UPI001C539FDB|nr:McKusick-Kaufman/Bardet-Biedl syndromes putative chaperonin [Dipodomys spectabilis]
MKNSSWIRKNWLLVAGVSFIGVHLGTYFMQRVAKQSVRSQSADKQRNVEE